jgi:hypothetical protein
MKNQIIILMSAALMSAAGCKKNDCAPNADTQSTTVYTDSTDTRMTASDTVSNETYRATTATATATTSGQQKFFKRKPAPKKLTQYQLDSIKTERGAIVTPAENVGASLTPGSGKAVPSNNKVGPGTNATMGSSTGN